MFGLILSSVQAITQVMVIVLTGFLLAKYEYMSDEQQKYLSKLNMVLFTPCLLFANIASVVSFEKIINLWPIPSFYLSFLFISWAVSTLISRILGVDSYQKRFVLACSFFSNVNSLPVAIMAGLAVSEASKSLYRGSNDSQELVAARGVSYVLFFGLFSNFLRWSYGFSLLRKRQTVDSAQQILPINIPIENRHYKYGSIDTVPFGRHIFKIPQTIISYIHSCISPPLYAAILALIVGLCRPIKDLMYNTFIYASFTRAIESCGKASVPIVLVCLGAQLRTIGQTKKSVSKDVLQTVKATILARILLIPLFVIPIVFVFAKFGHNLFDLARDPVFIVAIIVAGCMPTSINLAQITQANNAFQEEMLHVLFWSYGVLCIPLCTLVVFASLFIVDNIP